MDRKKLLNYCIEEAQNGKDLDEIRKELQQLELGEQDITDIIKYVSNKMINRDLANTQKSYRREYYLIGWFLLVAGSFITIATYTGLIYMGNSYIISLGPIIVGIALITGNRPNS